MDNTDKSDQQTYFHCGPYDFDGEQKPFITVLREMINKIIVNWSLNSTCIVSEHTFVEVSEHRGVRT